MDDTDKTFIDKQLGDNVSAEADESLHIDAYYKGFHVGLTKRDRDAKLKPYIDDAKVMINYLVSEGFEPSWNTETNKGFQGGVQNAAVVSPVVPERVEDLGVCKICGTKNILSKNFKPYCPNKCWLKAAK